MCTKASHRKSDPKNILPLFHDFEGHQYPVPSFYFNFYFSMRIAASMEKPPKVLSYRFGSSQLCPDPSRSVEILKMIKWSKWWIILLKTGVVKCLMNLENEWPIFDFLAYFGGQYWLPVSTILWSLVTTLNQSFLIKITIWYQCLVPDTYSGEKPSTWRILICLTIVLLPDSPAPEKRKKRWRRFRNS